MWEDCGGWECDDGGQWGENIPQGVCGLQQMWSTNHREILCWGSENGVPGMLGKTGEPSKKDFL